MTWGPARPNVCSDTFDSKQMMTTHFVNAHLNSSNFRLKGSPFSLAPISRVINWNRRGQVLNEILDARKVFSQNIFLHSKLA